MNFFVLGSFERADSVDGLSGREEIRPKFAVTVMLCFLVSGKKQHYSTRLLWVHSPWQTSSSSSLTPVLHVLLAVPPPSLVHKPPLITKNFNLLTHVCGSSSICQVCAASVLVLFHGKIYCLKIHHFQSPVGFLYIKYCKLDIHKNELFCGWKENKAL